MDDLPAFTQGLVWSATDNGTFLELPWPSYAVYRKVCSDNGGCVAQKLDSVIGVVNCGNDQVCLGVH